MLLNKRQKEVIVNLAFKEIEHNWNNFSETGDQKYFMLQHYVGIPIVTLASQIRIFKGEEATSIFKRYKRDVRRALKEDVVLLHAVAFDRRFLRDDLFPNSSYKRVFMNFVKKTISWDKGGTLIRREPKFYPSFFFFFLSISVEMDNFALYQEVVGKCVWDLREFTSLLRLDELDYIQADALQPKWWPSYGDELVELFATTKSATHEDFSSSAFDMTFNIREAQGALLRSKREYVLMKSGLEKRKKKTKKKSIKSFYTSGMAKQESTYLSLNREKFNFNFFCINFSIKERSLICSLLLGGISSSALWELQFRDPLLMRQMIVNMSKKFSYQQLSHTGWRITEKGLIEVEDLSKEEREIREELWVKNCSWLKKDFLYYHIAFWGKDVAIANQMSSNPFDSLLITEDIYCKYASGESLPFGSLYKKPTVFIRQLDNARKKIFGSEKEYSFSSFCNKMEKYPIREIQQQKLDIQIGCLTVNKVVQRSDKPVWGDSSLNTRDRNIYHQVVMLRPAYGRMAWLDKERRIAETTPNLAQHCCLHGRFLYKGMKIFGASALGYKKGEIQGWIYYTNDKMSPGCELDSGFLILPDEDWDAMSYLFERDLFLLPQLLAHNGVRYCSVPARNGSIGNWCFDGLEDEERKYEDARYSVPPAVSAFTVKTPNVDLLTYGLVGISFPSKQLISCVKGLEKRISRITNPNFQLSVLGKGVLNTFGALCVADPADKKKQRFELCRPVYNPRDMRWSWEVLEELDKVDESPFAYSVVDSIALLSGTDYVRKHLPVGCHNHTDKEGFLKTSGSMSEMELWYNAYKEQDVYIQDKMIRSKRNCTDSVLRLENLEKTSVVCWRDE